MKQDHQGLTAKAVVLRHMEQAALRGDAKALEGHRLVLQAIIHSAEKNTYLRQNGARSV